MPKPLAHLRHGQACVHTWPAPRGLCRVRWKMTIILHLNKRGFTLGGAVRREESHLTGLKIPSESHTLGPDTFVRKAQCLNFCYCFSRELYNRSLHEGKPVQRWCAFSARSWRIPGPSGPEVTCQRGCRCRLIRASAAGQETSGPHPTAQDAAAAVMSFPELLRL